MLQIRKSLTARETLISDMGRSASRPIVRVAAMAVISNPFAGRYVDDLTELFEAGRALGEQFMTDLVHMLSQDPVSYGKGAIVGLNGEFKVAACGASLDIPLTHKDNAWSFDHFDTMTLSIADAPKSDEIVVVMAVADGGRLHPRCGQAPR